MKTIREKAESILRLFPTEIPAEYQERTIGLIMRALEDQAYESMRAEREGCIDLAVRMPTPKGSSADVQQAIAVAIKGRG